MNTRNRQTQFLQIASVSCGNKSFSVGLFANISSNLSFFQKILQKYSALYWNQLRKNLLSAMASEKVSKYLFRQLSLLRKKIWLGSIRNTLEERASFGLPKTYVNLNLLS